MHKAVLTLARAMAVLGGLVLVSLIAVTCVSVAGRILNGWLHGDLLQGFAPGTADWLIGIGVGPLLGDFELVEAGMAFAIFAFLPLCQITRSHASVDIFTSYMPAVLNRVISVLVELVFAAVLILIAQRLYIGTLDKMAYNETTFMLQFPIWWAYGASLVAAIVAALVAVYMPFARLAGALPDPGEVEF
ncbi:MAG: TRAP transporter small permease subunit [Pseudomonadota bacterium]